ncbi:hypothetical protein EP47_03660 [Legionella norrlandica]|uniref:Uncharacterized protein n=1 Tax=Legionella norrlandica TaxID=1498499 RepID=A0A0A2SSE1_9GAMM|nr:hypothetical protein [Legionella norrlandica]KGP64030.1 hypothetical protein EP47_03660 [Legionella norrlandica]
MKVIKQVARFFSTAYAFARHGLLMITFFLKIFRRLRHLNPRSHSREKANKNWHHLFQNIKPLLFNLGQTISQPEILRNKISKVLTTVQTKMESADIDKSITEHRLEQDSQINSITFEPMDDSSTQIMVMQQTTTDADQLSGKVKQLLHELGITQLTGDKLANQINILLSKGLEFKKYINDSIKINISEYLDEELRGFTSRNQLDDFIQELDELSLKAHQLEAHIQQLMSCHEIN